VLLLHLLLQVYLLLPFADHRPTRHLLQVLLEFRHLLQQFSNEPEGRLPRTLQLLNSRGYRQHFDSLERDLRECLVRLSTALDTSHFASQVPACPFTSPHVSRT
jgi:hypothetical protein